MVMIRRALFCRPPPTRPHPDGDTTLNHGPEWLRSTFALLYSDHTHTTHDDHKYTSGQLRWMLLKQYNNKRHRILRLE